MANWCYTNYVFEGNKEEIADMYGKMQSLSKMEQSLKENDFDKSWLGNVVSLYGGDWKKIPCRGDFFNLDKNDDTSLQFTTETAWGDMDDVWKFVCGQYESIVYYFSAEEPGTGYYATNDAEGKYFPERYIVEQLEKDTEYYENEQGLFSVISERTGNPVTNKEEMEKAVEEYNTQNEGNEIYINEFSIIQD